MKITSKYFFRHTESTECKAFYESLKQICRDISGTGHNMRYCTKLDNSKKLLCVEVVTWDDDEDE